MIIFLYGADTFRSRRFLQELKDKFIRDVDPDSDSFGVIDGQSASLKEIGEKINTGSLFVKKRLVVIENIFKNKSEKIGGELNDYLKKFTGDAENILIFRDGELDSREVPVKATNKKLFAFLSKQPYSQRFDSLNRNQLLSFIKKESARYNQNISLPLAARLLDLSGGDLWILVQEIKKLSAYVLNRQITLADIDQLVASVANENIFGLTDAFSARNRKLALSLMEEQYAAGLSAEYLLTMLTRQFKILLQINEALKNKMTATEITSQLKLHPYVVKKGITQTKNFSGDTLKNYLNRLISLDFLNKSGRSDLKTELSLLISEL